MTLATVITSNVHILIAGLLFLIPVVSFVAHLIGSVWSGSPVVEPAFIPVVYVEPTHFCRECHLRHGDHCPNAEY